ncbi:MAG: S1C family serine protease [Candidatus Dormibacteria bacterium]
MDAEPPGRQAQQPPGWDSWAPYGWDSGAAGQDAYGGYTTWSYPPWAEPPPPPPAPPSLRRWMVAVVLITLVVIGGIAGVGVSLWRTATPASPTGSVSGSVAQVDKAVVDITSRLADGSGVAAGTGMVISPSGEVLTNNHVIRGGIHITAQIDGAGTDYPVSVIGVDTGHDVALLQLQGAANLPTVSFADSQQLKVGDTITALGNALGQGGQPLASPGAVTAVGETITVSDEMGGSETLSNLIQIDAQVLQGDSGGPLLNAAGKVVGMDTAAEVSGPRRAPQSAAGYAIPSNDALSAVRQIQRGGGGSVQPGSQPLLGVEAADSGASRPGVAVTGVQSGSPAEQAGLSNGDVITAIDGQTITSTAQLRTAVQGHKIGDQVRITWTDQGGQTHSASVRLVGGPPA